MANGINTIEEIIGKINQTMKQFEKATTALQDDYWDELLEGVLALEYVNRQLAPNRKNLNAMAKIKAGLEGFLRSRDNTGYIKDFTASYLELEKLNNDYFKSIIDNFSIPDGLNVIRQSSVLSLADSLTGSGINGAVTNRVLDIMTENLQSGTSRSKLIKQLQGFVLGDKGELGALHRYAKQIATDSINQFNSAYNIAITNSLGFTWYRYVGRVKDTTRPFCRALVKQRYVHKSELSKIAEGRLRSGTVSTAGMVKGTNSDNIFTYRGGYNCNHQFVGVTTKSVPKSVRDAVFNQ